MFNSLHINEDIMKLLVSGSQSITNFDLSEYINNDTTLIISGGNIGIDTIAEEYADKHGISKLILRPNYKIYPDSASTMRDEQMVDICDAVLLIWDGKSQDIIHIIKCVNKLCKPIRIFLFQS